MNVNNQDSEYTTFAQNCITHGLNFIMLSNDLFAKIAHHLNNNLDTEHEEIIGSGPDNLELRLDVTGRNVTFTLEDAKALS